MKIESPELNQNGDFIDGMPGVQLFSLESSDVDDIFGDPEMFPRVGEEYQAEIPPLLSKSSYHSYLAKSTGAENADEGPCGFLMGLPIPVMWIDKGVENIKHETLEFHGKLADGDDEKGPSSSECVKGNHICLEEKVSKFKVEPLDVTIDNVERIRASGNVPLDGKMHRYNGPSYSLVPGTFGDLWCEIEEASFLLGLYIFEKNFVQVKRFIESKKIGDILSFYYGRFYRSDKYCRWSECRKMRRSRCVYGQRIFSGMRQQELLSRLLPHVSEECQNSLIEVSRTFGIGKVSLEEYVSSLKAIVGMNNLVDAVGIGKGKQDLTMMIVEPLRSNQVNSARQEIPTGKACSSLMPGEIIKFLTGDYRLSKARSNDLFWEAVWPRLLARGWHSEQPKSQGCALGSKNSLVFLMPGIKKFSRRKLVKGTHYFDSVTDVLSKVASEPGLIELEVGECQGNRSKEGNGWTNDIKAEEESPSRQLHCYLQPRTPKRTADDMKFTVVDTSLADGKTCKVRQLRTLPCKMSKRSTSASRSEVSDEDSSEVSTSESKSADAMELDREEANNVKNIKSVCDWESLSNRRNLDIDASDQAKKSLDSSNVPLKNRGNHRNLCEEKQPRKAANFHLPRRLKQDDLEYIAPVTKRHRRLTACSRAETNHSMISFAVGPRLIEDKSNCCIDAPVLTENILPQIGSSGDKAPFSSSPKEGPIESSKAAVNYDCHLAQLPSEGSECWTLIDLNLPQAPPPDYETGVFITEITERKYGQANEEQGHQVGTLLTELTGVKGDLTNKEPKGSCESTSSLAADRSEQQPGMNCRRQSTRNRPPTARALEALACGFLTTNRRNKGKERGPHRNSTSRPSRRTCRGMVVAEVSTGTMAPPKAEERIHTGIYIGDDSSRLGNFQFQPEGEGNHVSDP